ncbi:DUF973 family protein [Acidianus brierleyi]|uniref:DUF973 domain-containing protein n=1 Tax=Acidianus brierleyi TaxID=41673 RepID=A0A2U9IHW6_9CREN|nr:DUF973 family protein [Acidianus brierleyi]AWR95619.1 DUF973 family protein [Acidianus brierleyi]
MSYNNPNLPNNQNNYQKDREALSKIRLYALLQIVTIIIGIVGSIALIATIIPTLLLSSAVPSNLVVLLTPIIGILIGLTILLLIISIVSILQLRKGYGILKTLSSDFSPPFTGTTLILIAIPLIILGLIVLALTIVPIIPLIVKHPHTVPSNILPSIALGLIIIVIAGIMALIGDILYSIVGSFNLSKRYGEEGFKTAGYLFIIALVLSLFNSLSQIFVFISSILYFIGIILIYTSAGNVLKRLQ